MEIKKKKGIEDKIVSINHKTQGIPLTRDEIRIPSKLLRPQQDDERTRKQSQISDFDCAQISDFVEASPSATRSSPETSQPSHPTDPYQTIIECTSKTIYGYHYIKYD
ncbi:unnamed protein product [Arabis nemorensis]|uniref:Uncharacterized protein n=1 Tax=Arabis nemorensis TaxID=586526 RepID=A0A565CDR0_9BRAS|nr:unnamed protein product [Arabis nemorensis]